MPSRSRDRWRARGPASTEGARSTAAAFCAFVLLVALAAALAGCHASSPAARTPAVGIVANALEAGRAIGEVQDTARRAGARWLREEVRWSQVEPRPGARDWRAFDRVLANATRRGLRVLPLLHDAPAWATPADGGLPTAAAAYARFVRDAVARYGPGGTFWRERPRLDGRLAPRWFELWNEPYYHAGADGERDLRENAARYAALAAAAIPAAREASGAARMLVALQTSSLTRPGDHLAWLEALERADADVLRAADGFAVHPYDIVEPAGFRPLDELLAELSERGLDGQVWITEVGWSTCAGDDECVSERRQAASLATLLAAMRTRYAGRIEAVFLYHLYDWHVEPPGGREGGYGLLRVDGSRKPAWWSYRWGVTALAGRA